MDHAEDDYQITPGALIAVGLLALGAILVAVLSPSALGPPQAEALNQRLVAVEDTVQDGMVLRDAQTGAVLAELVIEGDLFAMTALRSVTGRVGARPESGGFTVLVIEQPDGTGFIRDPATGRTMPLSGFGPDNAEALLALVDG
ncbi:MAG: photosynthetic complex assembly protein PuhC [Oceanicaulis sp.]